MTWFAITDGAGNLVSTGTVPADNDSLAANGYFAIALEGDPAGKVWDKNTQTFVSAPPRPVLWRHGSSSSASPPASTSG
jgi:hypothetical protein